jgi:hypothetical protein
MSFQTRQQYSVYSLLQAIAHKLSSGAVTAIAASFPRRCYHADFNAIVHKQNAKLILSKGCMVKFLLLFIVTVE